MSLIKKPHELEVQPYTKTLIYGQPGLRKTTFALSSPSPLLLDFDGGVHRVDTRHQGDTVQVRSWEDVINVLQEDLSAYKTLVIDTAGKMLDFMTSYLISNDPKLGKKDGALSLQGYGARKVMFQNFLRQVMMMGKHLVFVAHEKEEKDGEQKIIRPEIGGSSAGDLIKELDLVGYMQSVGNKKTISFEPCEKFYGKNTCKLPNVIELISTLEQNTPNNQFTGIVDSFLASQEDRKKVYADYNILVELIQDNITEATDADSLNEKVEWAQGLQHIWDSKLLASYKIRARSTELGLEYDKKSKRYINPVQAADANGTNNLFAEGAAPDKGRKGKKEAADANG